MKALTNEEADLVEKIYKAYDVVSKKDISIEEVTDKSKYDAARFFTEDFEVYEDSKGHILEVVENKDTNEKYFVKVCKNTVKNRDKIAHKLQDFEELLTSKIAKFINDGKIRTLKVEKHSVNFFGTDVDFITDQNIAVLSAKVTSSYIIEADILLYGKRLKADLYIASNSVKLDYFESIRKGFYSKAYNKSLLYIDLVDFQSLMKLNKSDLENAIIERLSTVKFKWSDCQIESIYNKVIRKYVIERKLGFGFDKGKIDTNYSRLYVFYDDTSLQDSEIQNYLKQRSLERKENPKTCSIGDCIEPLNYNKKESEKLRLGEAGKCPYCLGVKNYGDYDVRNVSCYCCIDSKHNFAKMSMGSIVSLIKSDIDKELTKIEEEYKALEK